MRSLLCCRHLPVGHYPVLILALTTCGPAIAQDPQEATPPSQHLAAEYQSGRVQVKVEGQWFTDYVFDPEFKLPHFFPVNGPASGQSVTTRLADPYPHHLSLFFGCDRVNGGNYWQEPLARGQIVSHDLELTQTQGDYVEWKHHCRWERTGAEAPFDDHRTIRISAPSPNLRFIDFQIRLTARIDVRIMKSNHSLFAARMAPDLSVRQGGVLINARGDQGEKDTIGKPARWADYRGKREGKTEGLAILAHPSNRWFPSPWFTRDYGFFSPTPMQWLEEGHLDFKKGESLALRYLVVVHEGALTQERLDDLFRNWAGEAPDR